MSSIQEISYAYNAPHFVFCEDTNEVLTTNNLRGPHEYTFLVQRTTNTPFAKEIKVYKDGLGLTGGAESHSQRLQNK